MTSEADVLVDCHCATGENPLWHPAEERLYWVDIPEGVIYRYDPQTGRTEQFEQGRPVGGMTIQQDDTLLLFMSECAVAVWDDGDRTELLPSLPGEADNRFNDVAADPEGRVFCGTMTAPTHPGRLYRLDRDGAVTTMLDDIGTSNGIGFSPGLDVMYYTDTGARTIYRFDYDRESGQLARQSVFAEAKDGRGKPDGLTVDAEGCVWSARWAGAGIVRYAPDGREIAWYDVPARNVSSLTFGGPGGTGIYITTAVGKDPENAGPRDGAVFYMDLGIEGRPEFRSRIGTAAD